MSDLAVKTLGPRTVPSPLGLSTTLGDEVADYIDDEMRVVMQIERREGADLGFSHAFEKAGPREKIYFDPARTRVGIVSCGGLCPGINNVIRSIVLELTHKYGVRDVLGFRYGFRGLDIASSAPPIPLTPAEVLHVHRQGGSFLGLSRGRRDPAAMVDALEHLGIDILFAIGGDGTLRGLHSIATEIERRGLRIAVVGVPKTIDNDIEFVDKTFGYDTAVEVARLAVDAAHTEALCAVNGVGIVKLMGRGAGFIAAAATLASHDVNFCLIPELSFDLDGPNGLLSSLDRRLAERGHAVIVVAEGCGERLLRDGAERDASGNLRFSSEGLDIGTHLRDVITRHFAAQRVEATVKYIDPSYMIRSVPANAHDAVFCDALARNAVHAGMAGKTDIVVGRMHRVFTHVPIGTAVRQKKKVNLDGALWLAVTETTGQPRLRA
ncbi:MAG: ATP-dependent 6-phosphofructokinase [Polyangiaceae bacterium]